MITTQEEQFIDELIGRGMSLALWRIPGEETIHFRMQSVGQPDLLECIDALNGQQGFVMAPFHTEPGQPVVLIRPDIERLEEARHCVAQQPAVVAPTGLVEESEAESPAIEKEHYLACFQRFMEPLHRGIQDKLVLSRHHAMAKTIDFSPAATFSAAVKRYIHSYVYLCHTPFTGTWIGSTPEILLAGREGSWQTVALAGTQAIRHGLIPQQWDDKNWREQQLVAYYIRRQLDSFGIVSKEQGPYAIRAGEVSHLKSDFQFHLADHERLGDLLALLHPTPAVCGLPKEEAYRFILEQEGYNRSYYSGFVGWLDPTFRSDLYVNLRCMRVGQKQLHFYAGGGLLASSQAESEWQETQDKLATMERLI